MDASLAQKSGSLTGEPAPQHGLPFTYLPKKSCPRGSWGDKQFFVGRESREGNNPTAGQNRVARAMAF
jgi:hypothetical protein